MLQQHYHLRLYDVQRAEHALFDKDFNAEDPIGDVPYFASTLNPTTDLEDRARFHWQVNNNIVVKTIENMLSVNGMDDLLADKELFTYVNAESQAERHRATMICLNHSRVDPTTEVGIDVHLKKLERYKMGDRNNDVAVMLCFMEDHCHFFVITERSPATTGGYFWTHS